jgi:hypothetical protein
VFALQLFVYGLCVWLVLWAIGTKPFPAFLIPAFLVVVGFAWMLWGSAVKRQLGKE